MRIESEPPPIGEYIEIAGTALATHQLAALIVGALFLLLGWVLYRVMIVFTGLVLGAGAGFGIAQLAARAFELEGIAAWGTMAGAAVLGAIAGVFIIRMLHMLAFFLFGAVLGGWAWSEVYYRLIDAGKVAEFDPIIYGAWMVVIGAACGVILAAFNRHVIAIGAALIGSLLIMGALDWPLHGIPIVPLFLVGAWVQIKLSGQLPVEED